MFQKSRMRIDRARIPRSNVSLRNLFEIVNELVWVGFDCDWFAASGVEGHGTLCGTAAVARDARARSSDLDGKLSGRAVRFGSIADCRAPCVHSRLWQTLLLQAIDTKPFAELLWLHDVREQHAGICPPRSRACRAYLFVQKYAASGFSSAHESALTGRPHVFALVGAH